MRGAEAITPGKRDPLERFSSEEQQLIRQRIHVLSSLVYLIGKDYKMGIEVNSEPGWHWDQEKNVVRVDPQHLLEKPIEFLRFVMSHEAGHRRITRILEVIPKEVWEQPGFSFLWNVIEDPRDNNFVADNIPHFKDEMSFQYGPKSETEQFEADMQQAILKKLGLSLRFEEAGFEYIKLWYKAAQGEAPTLSPDLSPEVRAVIEQTLPYAVESWNTYPTRQEADEGVVLNGTVLTAEETVLAYARESYKIIHEKIWPIFKTLIDKDIEDVKKKVQEQKEKTKKGDPKDKTSEEGNQDPTGPEEKNDSGQPETSPSSNDATKNPPKNGSGEAGGPTQPPANKPEDGSPKKGDATPKEPTGTPEPKEGGSADELPESGEEEPVSLTEEEIAEIIEEIRKFAEELAKYFEGESVKSDEKVLVNAPAEKKKGDGQSEEKAKTDNNSVPVPGEGRLGAPEKNEIPLDPRIEEIVRAFEARNEKTITPYQEVLREHSALIDQLTQELQEIFNKRRHTKWAAGYKSGKKVNISRAIQEEVQSTSPFDTRAFMRRDLPQETDYAVNLLIDLSGSMRDGNIKEAYKATVVLAEVFHNIGIPLAITGFHDRLVKYKEYDNELIDGTRKKFESMFKEVYSPSSAYNDDGWALSSTHDQILAREETQKIIFIISDGLPLPSRDHRGFDLHEVVKSIVTKGEVKLVALGLGKDTGHVHRFYPNAVADIQVGDLAKVLAQKIKAAIEEV